MNFLSSIFDLLKSIYLFYFKIFYTPLNIFLESDTAYFLSTYLHMLFIVTFLFSALITRNKFTRDLQNISVHVFTFLMSSLFVFIVQDLKSLEEFTFGGFMILGSAMYSIMKMRHDINVVEIGNDYSRQKDYYEESTYEEDLENEIEDLRSEIEELKKRD